MRYALILSGGNTAGSPPDAAQRPPDAAKHPPGCGQLPARCGPAPARCGPAAPTGFRVGPLGQSVTLAHTHRPKCAVGGIPNPPDAFSPHRPFAHAHPLSHLECGGGC